jgi:hypothetical protein
VRDAANFRPLTFTFIFFMRLTWPFLSRWQQSRPGGQTKTVWRHPSPWANIGSRPADSGLVSSNEIN